MGKNKRCETCINWFPPSKYILGTCKIRFGNWDADEFCNLWEKEPNAYVDTMKQKYHKFMEGGGHD